LRKLERQKSQIELPKSQRLEGRNLRWKRITAKRNHASPRAKRKEPEAFDSP
jgi:hypothetical protein